jgi:hypothetical protein
LTAVGGAAGAAVGGRAPLWSLTTVLEALAILVVLTLLAADSSPLVIVPLLLVIAAAQHHGAGRLSLPTLLLGLAAADVSRLAGWWPCEVACQGGAHYQAVAGIPVVWLGLLAHAGLAALAFRDARRGSWCAWTIRLCWILAGTAVFFLGIAWQLGLHCPFCRMAQTGALLALFLVRPLAPGMRWWHAAGWLLAGWLLANATFHHAPVADAPAIPTITPPAVTAPADDAVYQRADANRRQGPATAPLRAELVVDFTCPHCAELHGPLLQALKQPLAEGRVELVTRHLVRQAPPLHRELARLAFAAATLSAADHRLAVTTLLGVQRDARLDSLRARLSEAIVLADLDAVLRDHAPVIERLIDDDQRRLIALDAAVQTPSLVISRRSSGEVVTRWQGSALNVGAIPDVLAALAQP